MGGLLFSEEERVQDRGSGKVNAELWASEFGAKDWVEAVWGALSGSSVKFLDRLLIISYYQVMAVTETKVIISACWMASNTGTVGCTTAASWLSPVCRWWCDWWHQKDRVRREQLFPRRFIRVLEKRSFNLDWSAIITTSVGLISWLVIGPCSQAPFSWRTRVRTLPLP